MVRPGGLLRGGFESLSLTSAMCLVVSHVPVLHRFRGGEKGCAPQFCFD